MKISSGQQKSPYRIILYGQPKLRKSLFMSYAPGVWFIDPSKGTHRLNVNRIDISNYVELRNAVNYLKSLDACNSIVIDEWSSIQDMIADSITSEAGVEALKDIPYGTGYVKFTNKVKVLLSDLELMSATKNIAIIGHTEVKTFKNPQGSDYDMYEMACDQKRVWPLFYKWADAILFFSQHRSAEKKDDKIIAVKGETKIFTTWDSAYNAGNRFNMPPAIKIDGAYEKFQAYVDQTAKSIEQLQEECKTVAGYEANKENHNWLVMASVHKRFSNNG